MAINNSSWSSPQVWRSAKAALDLDRDFVIFDCETTGLSPEKDKMIELAAIKYRVGDNYTLHEIDRFHQYFNPGYPLPYKIVELTGITDKILSDKPSDEDCINDIFVFFDECIVGGHNVNFDVRFIAALYSRFGIEFEPLGVIDSLNLARNVLAKGTVKNYKLGTLGDYYGIEFGAHAAHEDVAATATLMQILFRELCEMYNDESNKPNVMLVKPKIRSIIFWEGYRGFSRIYVYTDSGTVYYDIRCHHWGGKDVDLSEIDMEYIEQESFRLTNTDSEETFGKFKGKIAV